MSWFRRYLKSSIGMKQTMAVTGLIMVLWVTLHMLDNLQMYVGRNAVNSFAVVLHNDLGPLLWLVRVVVIAALLIHIASALRLSALNKAARPVPYAKYRPRVTTIYARYMAWTGLIIFAFIVYHLLNFTFGVVLHQNYLMVDTQGRHDVYGMVVAGFQNPLVAASYIVAVGLLAFHLAHGVPSFFQTLGMNHPKYNLVIRRVGRALALILFVGFASIPVSVFLGWVR